MWGYSIFNPWPFLIVAAGRSMELYQLHWPQPQCLHRKEHLLSWGTEQRGIIAYGLWMCGPVHTVYAGVWKSSTHQDNETTLQHGIAKVKPRRHIIIYNRIYLWHDCSHANWDETCLLPIGSMYGIYTNIGGILMVNVTICGIHGSYGLWFISCYFQYLLMCCVIFGVKISEKRGGFSIFRISGGVNGAWLVNESTVNDI